METINVNKAVNFMTPQKKKQINRANQLYNLISKYCEKHKIQYGEHNEKLFSNNQECKKKFIDFCIKHS